MPQICVLLVLAVVTGCAETEEVGSGALPVVPVTWTNVVGASAVGNDLTKTASGTLWNAGASSVETLTGDGYVEFTSGETTAAKACGLGSGDASQHYGDIEFAIRLGESGGVAVFESGTEVFMGGGYQAGDVFRVVVLGGVVTYWQEGMLLYTSAAPAPAFPLVVDTSLRTPGATINEVAIESLVFWKSVVRAQAAGNDLVKTDPGTSWNAGAVSIAKLTGDGYVGFTTSENDTDKIAGLSHQNGGAGFADIDFGVYLRANGRIAVVEAGVNRGGFGKYVAGDVFRVQVAGGEVSYWKNGNRFYTSTVAPVFPLLLDTSLRTPGATVNDGVVVAGLGEELCLALAQGISSGDYNWSIDAAPGLLVGAAWSADPPYAAVYQPGSNGWQLDQSLTRPDGSGGEWARLVATDGQTIAVSDYLGSDPLVVYRDDGQEWVVDDLLGKCSGHGDFGTYVAVQGNFLVTQAFDVDLDVAVAYVFRRGANAWFRDAIITLPETNGVHSVAIGGDRIFLGAPYNDALGDRAGAVYVYRRGSGSADSGTCSDPLPGAWRLETILRPSNARAEDRFAWSGIEANRSGTQVVVGNPQHGYYDWTEFFPNGLGTVHLFSLTPQGWQETFKFEPTFDPASEFWEGPQFGNYLAFGGPDLDAPSFLVIGPQEEYSAWVFRPTGGGSWNAVGRLDDLGSLGIKVAATEDSVFVSGGAIYDYDVFTCPAP